MSNPTPTTRSFDHLVYLRIFEGCNLHCKHCFIPSNPKKIDFEKLKEVPKLLEKRIPIGSKILLQWHGGEPTLLGKEYISEGIKIIQEFGKDYEWIHGIQTNLMNYDSSWNELYRTSFDNEVGVSWDPIIRGFKSGDESTRFERFNEQFWQQIKLMNDSEINIYLVMTATKTLFNYFKNPFDLFELLYQHKIKNAHLERITNTGYARENWNEVGLNNKEYSEYMSRFYKAYKLWNINNPTKKIALSPFDGLEESVHKLEMNDQPEGYGCWSGKCDTTFHTIDSNGYKMGCTAVTSEFDNPKNKSVVITLFGKNNIDLVKEREIRQAPCQTCEFLKICSSGCLTTRKIDESNECSGGKILFQNMRNFII